MGAPEAAEYLGVVLRTLYKFLDEGAIPAYKLGRVIRLKREDVDAFLESQRVVPGSLSHLYSPYDDHREEHDDEGASGLPLSALTVSVAQAGQMLGMSRAEAFRRAKTGELVPGVHVLAIGPRVTRVSRAHIEAYLAREANRDR